MCLDFVLGQRALQGRETGKPLATGLPGVFTLSKAQLSRGKIFPENLECVRYVLRADWFGPEKGQQEPSQIIFEFNLNRPCTITAYRLSMSSTA